MKPETIIACVATICLLVGCSKSTPASVPPSDPRIVGSWTIEGGDYPLTNEYRADGTLVQRVSGKVTDPSPFRIEGNQLIVSVVQPDGKITEQKDTFVLNGDTLTFIDSPTRKRVFRRDR